MNRDQKIARLSNAQQALARRTSELFEPGYDPYNSALHHARKLPDDLLIEWTLRSGTIDTEHAS